MINTRKLKHFSSIYSTLIILHIFIETRRKGENSFWFDFPPYATTIQLQGYFLKKKPARLSHLELWAPCSVGFAKRCFLYAFYSAQMRIYCRSEPDFISAVLDPKWPVHAYCNARLIFSHQFEHEKWQAWWGKARWCHSAGVGSWHPPRLGEYLYVSSGNDNPSVYIVHPTHGVFTLFLLCFILLNQTITWHAINIKVIFVNRKEFDSFYVWKTR